MIELEEKLYMVIDDSHTLAPKDYPPQPTDPELIRWEAELNRKIKQQIKTGYFNKKKY